jgi:hypothetical protein
VIVADEAQGLAWGKEGASGIGVVVNHLYCRVIHCEQACSGFIFWVWLALSPSLGCIASVADSS